jgi:CRP-like cAMP-binding protein
MTIQPLIDHFETYLPVNETDKVFLESRVIQRSVKRRQFILQEGFPCKHYTFIISGCFKMFGVDSKGTEHNIQFAIENDWIADIGSFHSGKSSKLFIEAVEPAVILQIEQKDLYFLYNNIPKLNQIFKVIVENKYVELQNRVLQNISSTALERYLAFQEQYPTLALRLPNTQIASYLGITPEFLSKIRKDIATESANLKLS